MTDVDAFRDAEYIADVSGLSFDNAEPGSTAATPSGPDNRRIRKLQCSAKIAFIDRLLRDLDILIYCELSALYYMEYAAPLPQAATIMHGATPSPPRHH